MALGLNRPDGSLDLKGALDPYRGPWNERTAAHLLRRAGFGGTPEQIARTASMRAHDAVESLVHFPSAGDLPQQPDNVYDPRPDYLSMRSSGMRPDAAALKELNKKQRASILDKQSWWLNRMLLTPAPLQEKMALYLHGHFTTAAIQKGVFPQYVWRQNELFRNSALGNLRDLTLAVSRDPAMLLYLDNARSTRGNPNENYARELMELFTLGHGNYSEEDIRQSARAFTGWTIDRRTGEFIVNPRVHDDGSKTFLGRSGNLDGTGIVQIIYQQNACARFWSQSLLNYFLYNNPEPELIDALALVIRKNDYNLAPVMSTLLQSAVFFSPRAYRALVKSPVEFVVGTVNAFGLSHVDLSALRALNQMGQILFYPPNVAGWPGGTNWITSQTMIARQNFVAGLVNLPAMDRSWLGRSPLEPHSAAKEIVAKLLQNDAPDQAYAQLVSYLNGGSTSALKSFSAENYQERIRGAAYLAAAMPAYQLS
ncbi:MAG: DUF1800 domain-containing protein [Candidatus Eremiobacteraeota bacterium]|nr:DUF1800 domain-containing protein [Candidatus Eremiobacteraeota bacterium]